MLYRDVESAYGGGGQAAGTGVGAQKGHPGAPTDGGGATQTHRHTKRDEGKHSRQGGGAQQDRRGNQDGEPEWRRWKSVRGAATTKGMPRRYWVPGQPLLNRHQVGGVSRSPDGLFAQQEREPTRGRPAVRGKGT